MAILKTVFSGITAETNAAEVTAWLQANATTFFSSITNESNIITCDVIGGGQLIIKPKVREWNVILKNGTVKVADHYNVSDVVNQAFVTSKGIALLSGDKMWIFVTKSNEGTIGVVFHENNTENNLSFADFSKSISFKGDPNNLKHIEMAVTSLCICPFGTSGTYSDGLYYVPFYEYSTKGIITVPITGKSYVYTGYLALEE